MRPISNEVREKVIKHHEKGKSAKTISKWLLISLNSVYKIVKLQKTTGSIQPKPYTSNYRKITAEQDIELRKIIKENASLTLNQLIETLNLNVTESGLSKHLDKMGLSYKKRHFIQTGRNGMMY